MKLTFLGSGTSHGIPVIGCNCKVCSSTDPKDNRYRASVLVENGDTVILIDVGPDFRTQALRQNITHLDAVLVTHGHADHLNGLDDLRIFSNTQIIKSLNYKKSLKTQNTLEPLKIYANSECLADVKSRFSYIFKHTQEGGGKPLFTLCNTKNYSANKPIVVSEINKKPVFCTPIPLKHGKLNTCGFLLKTDTSTTGGIAYITDCNFISQVSLNILQGIDCLIIDGLRNKKHTTHFSFDEALEVSAKIAANKTYFTHICHDNSHAEIISLLNEKKSNYQTLNGKIVEPAFDGLVIEV